MDNQEASMPQHWPGQGPRTTVSLCIWQPGPGHPDSHTGRVFPSIQSSVNHPHSQILSSSQFLYSGGQWEIRMEARTCKTEALTAKDARMGVLRSVAYSGVSGSCSRGVSSGREFTKHSKGSERVTMGLKATEAPRKPNALTRGKKRKPTTSTCALNT